MVNKVICHLHKPILKENIALKLLYIKILK